MILLLALGLGDGALWFDPPRQLLFRVHFVQICIGKQLLQCVCTIRTACAVAPLASSVMVITVILPGAAQAILPLIVMNRTLHYSTFADMLISVTFADVPAVALAQYDPTSVQPFFIIR